MGDAPEIPRGRTADAAESAPTSQWPEPGRRTEDGEEVHRRLDQVFQRALRESADAVGTRFYIFGGRTARIRVVGRALARRIARPFAHLEVGAPATPPELTIDLWDAAETAVSCEGCTPWADPTLHAAISTSPGERWLARRKAQTWIAFDRAEQHIVGWVADSDRLTQYELGRPLHSQLLLWHQDRGIQPVHAGLVARNGEGVLLAGPGGSGKSTVALTCLQAGFAYLADDYVGLEPLGEGGRYTGHSLYCSTHFEPRHLERFPALVPLAIPGTPPREDKSLIFLSEMPAARLDRSARIRAVAFPRVVDAATTSFRPAAKVDALLRLAPSSMLMIPFTAIEGGMRQLSQLIESVPAFWLELGRDLDAIPDRVDDLLAEAGRSARVC